MVERVVIYTRGSADQRAQQLDACLAQIEGQERELVSLAHDEGEQRTGWEDANRLVHAGGADLILMDSTAQMPAYISSVSRELRRTTRPRRPRRTSQ